MLYRYLIGIFFITICLLGKAQSPETNWLFGTKCAIDVYSVGTTTSIYGGSSSQMIMVEGGTSISDDGGNLLFYFSDGKIYTPSHTLMTNGALSIVNSSIAAQATSIVKVPNSSTLYYVFYTCDWNVSNQGLYYAIVDMSLSGGVGAVTIKDKLVNDKVKERLVSVNKPCSEDTWIVGHEQNNNNYVAYLLTANGFDSVPVVSSVGATHYASANIYGCLKLSQDATKLAIASGGNYGETLELSDFDYNTGIVSNTVTLAADSNMPKVYGVEFSPSGDILYATQFDSTKIYQYDLLQSNTSLIVASRKAIDNSSYVNKGSLLLASDGRIYASLVGSSYLGVINSPDVLGTSCNYSVSTTNTNGTVRMGLPNFTIRILTGCPYFDQCEDCIPSYSPEKTKTYVLSAWVKEEDPSKNKTTYNEAQISLAFAGSSTTAGPFKGKGNIIDGWQRIEEVFTVPGDAKDIQIKLSSPGVNGYFDDIRVFPTDGSMKSYVYDPISLKLVAELDENNYATFYEYDEEGALVRVKKETERGVMTIQENRSSTPKQ